MILRFTVVPHPDNLQVKILGRLDHENIVRFLGLCRQETEDMTTVRAV